MKDLIKRGLARLGYRIQGTRYTPRQLLEPNCLRPLELADVLCRRMIDVGESLTFLQIGAFDGITADPLYPYIARHGWRGVLVEPQPAYAERLRQLYRENDRILVIEAAIDSERRTRTLHTVVSAAVPDWAAGMASFDRSHIEKHAHLIPGIERMVQPIDVDCVVFEDVLSRMPGPDIDVLQIDAEGADERILSLFPFERQRPAIVHWEVRNLTTAERERCLDRLLRVGYRIAPSGDADMMAILDASALTCPADKR